ncbi:MAG: hypothetical protein ACYDAC_08305 [Candidatus Dormibacteria bacterium]
MTPTCYDGCIGADRFVRLVSATDADDRGPMLLIGSASVPTPADGERLVANLWQVSAGRPLGLFVIACGGTVHLGVHSPQAALEETTALLIADSAGGSVSPASVVENALDSTAEVAAANLLPVDRHLVIENRSFGWQRADPLRGPLLALHRADPALVVALGLSLRAVPDLGFVTSIGAVAAGPGAAAALVRFAASFGGIGVRVRRPLLQRRTCRRVMSAALRRPAAVLRVERVALFWHPPYGAASSQLPSPRGVLDG